MSHYSFDGAFLINAYQPGITHHVCSQNGGQTPFDVALVRSNHRGAILHRLGGGASPRGYVCGKHPYRMEKQGRILAFNGLPNTLLS
jgi:hypothetical protein